MGTHNGTVFGTTLKHKGDNAWSDLTSWTAYTNWTTYTDTTKETATGAKGTPLRYQTSIIDLGASKYVYPHIDIGIHGSAKITIEHGDASNLSDKTTIGTYTIDNSATGTVATYSVLDYTDADYSDGGTGTVSSTGYRLDYTGFKARYVRITIFVEKFKSASIRGMPVIKSMLINFKNDLDTEVLYDIDTSTLTGDADARVLVPNNVSTIVSMNLTAHAEANKELVPQIVSKANKTVKVVDANLFQTTGVDGTIDVMLTGLPSVQPTPNGGLDKQRTGELN